MQIVENKKTNMSFVISIAVMLSGLVFYLIHEFVSVMVASAHHAFAAIGDLLGIFALIGIIVSLFVPKIEKLLRNISIILGCGYVAFYLFGHFFTPSFYGTTGGLLTRFSLNGLSFIGLLLLFIFTILMIVIFSMRIKVQEDLPIYQKFSIILWLVLLGVFDFVCFYMVRLLAFGAILGITFLPTTLELIYFLFGATLLILSFFIGVKKNILSLLVLLFANILAVSYAIGTVNFVGFNFVVANTALIIGNFLIIMGAIALVVCTYFILKIKYEKPVAATK